MPKKQNVVKSEAVAVSAAAAPSRATRRAVPPSPRIPATEAPAPASDEKKAPRSRKKTDPVAVEETAAVKHRHKKETAVPVPQKFEAVPAAPVKAPAVAAPYEPANEEIAKLAYSYYVARGYQPGDPRTDWYRAVQELKARHAAAALLLDED